MTATSERAFRHIAVLLGGTFGTALLAFATQLILTRGMSVAEYGRLAAILAAINILTPIGLLGMGSVWLELFGKEGWGATRWMEPATRLSPFSSLLSAMLLIAYVAVTVKSDDPLHTLFVGMLVVPVFLGQILAETTAARFQLEERYFSLAGWQMFTQTGRAFVAIALLTAGSLHIMGVLAGYAVVGFVIVVVSLMSIQHVRQRRIRLAGHDPAPDSVNLGPAPGLGEMLRRASPHSLGTLFYLMYAQGIVAVVALILGPDAAGIYNVAFLITAVVYLIPHVVYTKYLAGKLFRWGEHDRTRFASAFHIGVVAHGAMGLLCAGIVAWTADSMISALFGPRYSSAAPVLLVLTIGIPLRFIQHAYGSALVSQQQIRRKIGYMGCGAAAVVVLASVLTPAFGLVGAAASIVLSELLLLALYVYGVIQHVEMIDVGATFRRTTLRSSLAYLVPRESKAEVQKEGTL